MHFLEMLALVGTAATILGVFLTGYAIINNKTLKRESGLTRETTEKLMKEESRLTREMIKEVTEYLGNLIVVEGNKTRSAMPEKG